MVGKIGWQACLEAIECSYIYSIENNDLIAMDR